MSDFSVLENIWNVYNGSYKLRSDAITNASMASRVTVSAVPVSYSRIVIDVYIVTSLCAVGFVGNALTIAVLCREKDRTNTTNWLLRTLAAVDTAYLVMCLFITPIKTIYHTGIYQSATAQDSWAPCWLLHVYPRIYPYILPFASIAQIITVWTVIVLTIDRYVAICQPFNPHLRVLRRAQLTMIAVGIIAVLYSIPVFFEREYVPAASDGGTGGRGTDLGARSGNLAVKVSSTGAGAARTRRESETRAWNVEGAAGTSTGSPADDHDMERTTEVVKELESGRCSWEGTETGQTERTEFSEEWSYQLVYRTICYCVFRSVGPLLVLLVLNVKLIQALRGTQQRRAEMKAKSKSQANRKNITLMLVIVVSVFIVCQLPDMTLRIVALFKVWHKFHIPTNNEENGEGVVGWNGDDEEWRERTVLINSITNLLITVNSSVNFLIYCLVGRKFRRILFDMLSCGRSRRGDASSNGPPTQHGGGGTVPAAAAQGALLADRTPSRATGDYQVPSKKSIVCAERPDTIETDLSPLVGASSPPVLLSLEATTPLEFVALTPTTTTTTDVQELGCHQL